MTSGLRGMRMFTLVWAGQVVSILGTGMTGFGLAIWLWDRTGEATPLALLGVLSGIAGLLSKLVAGPLVDRWDRRRIMIVSDFIAGLSGFILFLLYSGGRLEVWHLYVLSVITAFVRTFQYLAYSASLTLMVPKAQYARAQGMISLAEYASLIGAPFLGSLLIYAIGLQGVLLIDLMTFLFAVGILFAVRIPQPTRLEAETPKPLWRDSLLGFQYIFQRPGLTGLLLITFTFSLTEALAYPLLTPMILARTGGNAVTLGTIRAVQGIGGVVGGVFLSVWGGPKRRIHGVLIGIALTGLLGDAVLGVGRSLPGWIIGAFFLEFFLPLALSSYQAIWHAKVAPAMQGRVFAARDAMATLGEPASMLLGGVMTDQLLEPAMMPNGALSGVFGGLVGTGPGAGMSLLLVIGGVLSAVVGLSGYLFRRVREVETLLPDYDAEELAVQGAADSPP